MTDHIGVITLRDAAVNSVFLVVADLTGRTRARGTPLPSAAFGTSCAGPLREALASGTLLRQREKVSCPRSSRASRSRGRGVSLGHNGRPGGFRDGTAAKAFQPPGRVLGGKRKKARWIPEGERPT